MRRSIGHDDLAESLGGTEGAAGTEAFSLFTEDIRSAFPETAVSQREAESHIVAMMGAVQLLAEKGESALEPTSKAQGPDQRVSGLPKQRRRTMREKMILKTAAVTTAMLLSLGGLAFAGVLPAPWQDDEANTSQTVESSLTDGDDQGLSAEAVEPSDDVLSGGLEVADDQGEDADDQGEDADVSEVADDQGEDADDQGEDADDQGDVSENDQGNVSDDDQGNVADDDQGNVGDEEPQADDGAASDQ